MGRWLRGDEHAFDLLYNRHLTTVMRLIAQKTGCTQTAQEFAQDVFIEFYLQKERLEGIVHVKAYLLSMAKHKVFNYYRQALVQQKYRQHIMLQSEGNLTTPVTDQVEEKEIVQIVSSIIAALPPKCREAFLLSRDEKLSYKAIAQKMGISENTVDQHIRKALKSIRLALKDYDPAITKKQAL